MRLAQKKILNFDPKSRQFYCLQVHFLDHYQLLFFWKYGLYLIFCWKSPFLLQFHTYFIPQSKKIKCKNQYKVLLTTKFALSRIKKIVVFMSQAMNDHSRYYTFFILQNALLFWLRLHHKKSNSRKIPGKSRLNIFVLRAGRAYFVIILDPLWGFRELLTAFVLLIWQCKFI